MDNARLYLAEPSSGLRAPYNEMLEEWERAGERVIPWVLRLERLDFGRMLTHLQAMREGLVQGAVACSTYWLMRGDGVMLGASNIRHELNAELMETGGHIGYGIRPGERGKGYGTELLRLSLLELKKHGAKKALITCDSDNLASERVILKNGGAADTEIRRDGVMTKRFWIEL